MDLEFAEEQRAVVDVFAQIADRESSPAHVREHEALGFSRPLWDQLVAVGAPGMALPESAGGGGSTLLDLGLAIEALGRRLAPAPLIEHAVTARLLARCTDGLDRVPADIVDGTTIAAIALRPASDGVAALVPGGAIAEVVVALDRADLVMVHSAAPGRAVPNLASAPLADRSVGDAAGIERVVLATGDRASDLHASAVDEWRALTALALAGLGAGALAIACAYVSEREQFGVPIGSFQSIQHGLADVTVALDGAQLLARKAAWSFDRSPDDAPGLAAMALLFCAEQAQRAADRALHYHGGYGFMEEYDVQLFYRRAKGWPLVLGDPSRECERLAERRYGPLTVAGGH